jgi:hypothetical protein
MKKRLFHVGIAMAIVCVVLGPALIWSGHGPHATRQATNEDQGFFKEPPFFTVGPPMTPEELAAREQEKLRSIREGQTWFQDEAPMIDHPSDERGDAGPLPATEHKGLTPAELEKLAAIRGGALKPREDRGMWGPKPEVHLPKFDAPLRPLGSEGLTPQERAKLEASRSREAKANGDEGGRSK